MSRTSQGWVEREHPATGVFSAVESISEILGWTVRPCEDLPPPPAAVAVFRAFVAGAAAEDAQADAHAWYSFMLRKPSSDKP